jgi:hypothetical protein
LDIDASAGWSSPSSRGMWGGDSLLLSTALLGTEPSSRRHYGGIHQLSLTPPFFELPLRR